MNSGICHRIWGGQTEFSIGFSWSSGEAEPKRPPKKTRNSNRGRSRMPNRTDTTLRSSNQSSRRKRVEFTVPGKDSPNRDVRILESESTEDCTSPNWHARVFETTFVRSRVSNTSTVAWHLLELHSDATEGSSWCDLSSFCRELPTQECARFRSTA